MRNFRSLPHRFSTAKLFVLLQVVSEFSGDISANSRDISANQLEVNPGM